jgi:hypothetical protein
MEYTTVSAKIPRAIKKKLDEFGISPSEVIRRALYEELKEAELRKLKKEVKSVKPIIAKITSEVVVKSIREDREERDDL